MPADANTLDTVFTIASRTSRSLLVLKFSGARAGAALSKASDDLNAAIDQLDGIARDLQSTEATSNATITFATVRRAIAVLVALLFVATVSMFAPPAASAASGWTAQASATTSTLDGVSFADDFHGWAVGADGMIVATADGGKTWVDQQQKSGFAGSLRNVSFADVKHGWAVGGDPATILHTSDGGKNWDNAWSPASAGISDSHALLSSVKFRPNTADGWAVGGDTASGLILHTTDGVSWVLRIPFDDVDYYIDVAVTDADHVWALGLASHGPVLVSTADAGKTWKETYLHNPDGSPLSDVPWGLAVAGDGQHGLIVGDNGLVLRTVNGGYNSEDWVKAPSETTQRLYRVAFPTADQGWAVGDGGVVVATSDGGQTWAPQESGTAQPLLGVTFADAQHGWVVGLSGTSQTFSVLPRTTIVSGPPASSSQTTPTFTFEASDPLATFECKLDSGAAAPCTSPYRSGPLAVGVHTFTVRAVNVAGPDATPPSRSFTVTDPSVDIRVTGIEVTQGVQSRQCVCVGTLPSRDQTNLNSPGSVQYQGPTLAAGKFTVVRVFANFTRPADRRNLAGATAILRVYDSNGKQISMLTPESVPAALNRPDCGACVSARERANPSASFNFYVPWQETEHRALSFRATVSPPVGLGQPTQCAGCLANTFELIGVPFASTAKVPIHPIPLTVGGVTTKKTETQVFGGAQIVLPNDVQIFPYDTPLKVDGMDNTQALAAVLQRAIDDHLTSSDYPVGVFFRGEGKLADGKSNGRHLYDQDGPISIVQDDRPLTSVAHEIGHGLGLVHADTGSGPLNRGPHPDGTPDCGGNSHGQVGERWPDTAPFDNEGRLDSIGLDRRNWVIGKTGSLPQTFVEGFDHVGRAATGTRYYDFMSYCPRVGFSEANHWLSLRNWNRLIAFHPPAQTLPAAPDRRGGAAGRSRSGSRLQVIATIDPAGEASIFAVEPGEATPAHATPGSPYRIELRDATGAVLRSVTPSVTPIVDGGQAPSPLVLQATLPFVPSAASVVITSGGQQLAQRIRSKHAPTVAILTPRPRAHVGSAGTTLVRWTAHDADGDRLTATVDYSPDGGHTWKVVADRLRGGTALVPSSRLSASPQGRLRVRVGDGFNVTTRTSGPVVATGAPPYVRIIDSSQIGRGRLRSDATLLIKGVAFDDHGQPITGPNLTWYAGRRMLAHGTLLTVAGLPTGTTPIQLLATDNHGRTSRATFRLKVVAARPALLIARAPTHVSPNARSVRIVVAANAPAVLTIAHAHHHVDRKPRTITIRIRSGRSPLRLNYTLSSAAGARHLTYIATR